MDLTHIHAHLKRLFTSGGHDHAGSRIVWWQDSDGEFAEELDNLGIETCHDDGVALIRLGEQPTLGLKVRLLLEEPNGRFLIYEQSSTPDPAHDMLLDIRKWAAPFAADKSTLILRELGLVDDLSLKSHITQRARFFGSRDRVDTDLPDRIFEACPFVENDPTVATKVDPVFLPVRHRQSPF